MKWRWLYLFLLVISPALSHAADEEILAGLHEQVVQVPVRVEGLFGAREVNLTATIYRPNGDGPFPLVVLSHGTRNGTVTRSIFLVVGDT